MNCEEVQKKISKALAAGELALPSEMAGHEESCPACRNFYEAQQNLFRSLDAGLQTIANTPVPPSLLPAVRSRIENAAPRRAFIYTGVPVGAAVVLLCAVAFPLLHRTERRTAARLALSSEQRGNTLLNGGGVRAAVHPNLSAAPRVRRVGRARRAAPRTQSTSAHMEVVVSRDEARGLDQLVYSIHQKPALAEGFLRPATLPPDEMKPVPLIEIAELTMSPLADEQW